MEAKQAHFFTQESDSTDSSTDFHFISIEIGFSFISDLHDVCVQFLDKLSRYEVESVGCGLFHT